MIQNLYMRRARLRVGPLTIEAQGDDGLRFEFRVSKNPFASEPNHAAIEISNLNKTSRDLLAAAFDPARVGPPQPGFGAVELEAGYSGLAGQPGNFGRIFKGHIQNVVNTREKADWVTKILATDGLLSNEVRVTLPPFGKGVDIGTVVSTIAAKIKESVANLDISQITTRARAGDVSGAVGLFTKGLSVSGLGKNYLDKLLRPLGFEVNEDDGELILTAVDELRGRGILLNSSSGLVGTIDPIKDDKLPGVYIIKARSLLRHDIVMNSGVQIDSEVMKGLFKVRKLEHHGSTRGPEFLTTFEATQVRS